MPCVSHVTFYRNMAASNSKRSETRMEFPSSHILALLVILLLASMIPMSSASHEPRAYNLDDRCDETIEVDKAVIIRIKSEGFLKWNYKCGVKLKPKHGDGLTARFIHYELEWTSSLSGDCSRVAFFLRGDSGDKFGEHGYCGTERPETQYDLGKFGSFSYKTGDFVLTWKRPSVDLLVTEVKDKSKSNGTCPKGFFDCERRDYCIDNELTCNEYDDCGNNKDDETSKCGLSTGIIVAIVIGSLLGAVLIVALIVFLCKQCRD